MLNKIINDLKNKKIAILGFGIEGKSTYRFIKRNLKNADVTVLCNSISDKDRMIIEQEKIAKLITGEDYLKEMVRYDVIFKTPGISFKDIDISGFRDKITSELDLFLKYKSCTAIGITGTKGKSTTSSLIYEVIRNQRDNVHLLGNIGVPIFDEIEELKDDSTVVLELSSHALQYSKESIDIAILLNIYEEHLDHYKDFDEYIEAKLNIFKNQRESGIAVFNVDNPNIKYDFKNSDYGITIQENKKTDNTISLKNNTIYYNEEKIFEVNEDEIMLKGMHNINNIMFVLAVCKVMNLNIEEAIEKIKQFKPLEHRLEYVGNIDGVDYYNDSIATIPEATIASIKALKNVDTLIVGGKDRGVSLDGLVDFLYESSVRHIICMPTTGEYIAEKLKNSDKMIYKVSNMEEAVKIAKGNTTKNKICLLSPAAASYGFFKNFMERGNIFKENVLK